MKNIQKKTFSIWATTQKIRTAALLALLVTIPNFAFAATAATRAWPWRAFLQSLVEEFSGALPLSLGTLGICGCAIALFRGHSGEGTNKFIVLILAVSVCLAAPTIMGWLASDASGFTIGGL